MRSPRFNAAAIRGWRRALAICGVVVLLDQVSKAIVVSSLSVGEHERLGLGFSLTNTPNSGLAFGIARIAPLARHAQYAFSFFNMRASGVLTRI